MDIENFIDTDQLDAAVEAAPTIPQVLSFRKPVAEPAVTFPTERLVKKRFIIRSQIIDKFTTKRVRIELTPSVCDVCAFDVAAEKHKDWYGVPEFKKADVLQAVIEHKREAHPTREDLIVNEDELPTQWLGNSTTL